MELEEFIKNSLVNIASGIRGANEELAKREGKTLGQNTSAVFGMEPHNREKAYGYINFDVAVVANSENSKSGNGGIKVASIGVGGEISDVTQHGHFSRIQFHIIPNSYIG